MINLNFRTHYSLESLLKPNQVYGTHMAITDYKSMGGIVQFYKACKDKGVIPIIGYSDQEIFLAANKVQYKELLNAFSHGLIPKTISIVGAPFLGLWNLVQTKSFSPVFCEDAYNVAKSYILDLQTKVDCIFLAQTDRPELCYKAQNELIEDLAEDLGLPMVMIPEHYYNKPEDKEDHQLYIANKTKVKPREFENLEDRYKRFYLEGDYSVQENKWSEHFDDDKLVALIEPYDILSPPKLPKFSDNDDELFKEKLREGWKKLKLSGQTYVDRIKHEIDVLRKCKLAPYFLLVADMVNWAKDQGWLCGPGRGSACGCLTAYLLGITRIDPMKYGLFFERFWNESRVGIIPDVDCDFPRKKRHLVIEYLINKYGKPSVCQMITYFELQGRSALNLVLRFTEARDASEAHKITELLPEKSKVEDQMVAVGEKSLIKWTLENLPNRLSQYARIEDGKIVGDLAKEFEQAIRLEGTVVGSGKHASAVIVYDGTISDVCPMTRDKSSDELIGALDMGDSEQVGLVKLDVLGLATLDKLMIIKELVEAKNEQT